MKLFILIAAGGFFGAVARVYLTNLIQSKHKSSFPFGTFTVNIAGSFVLGFLFAADVLKPEIYFLLGTGFMGAFTTFSTFEMESTELIRKGKFFISSLYLAGSALFGILFAYIGYLIGKLLSW